MSDLLAPTPVTGTVPPSPADRMTGFTPLWVAWIALFFALEIPALVHDARAKDRAKRTLSSNMRYWFATDSVTGIPLDVPYGKLRRLVLVLLLAWFAAHIQRQDYV